MKSYEKDLKNLIKYPCTLPLSEAVPTGHPTAAELCRQVLPWDAGAQDEHDAREGSPLRRTWAPSALARGVLRQHRLEDRPQFIVDQVPSHALLAANIVPDPVHPVRPTVFLGALMGFRCCRD